MTDTPYEDPAHQPAGVATGTTSMSSSESTTQPSWTGEDDHSRARTRDVAADQAAGVAHEERNAAGEVAQTAKEQADALASEAKDHARRLYHETKHELTAQASSQQSRAASGLSALGTELRQMAERSDGGPAADLARQGADRAEAAASWLGDREPGDVMEDLSRWARQRPGTFLAAAAAIGLVAGRLTRGLADDARDDDDSESYSAGHARSSAPMAASSGQTGAAYPLASEDLPPAVEPDDWLGVRHDRVFEGRV